VAVTSVNACNECAIRANGYGVDPARPLCELEPLPFLPSLRVPQEGDGGLPDLPGHRQGSIRGDGKRRHVIGVVLIVIGHLL
jgi:hypothetical protein